jgi:repressor LexA
MDTIVQRLKTYLDFMGVNVSLAEKNVMLSNGSLSKPFNANTTIKTDTLEKFLTFYSDISPEWLLTGGGSMLKPTTTIKSYPKPDKKEKLLPLIPIEAIAGFGAGEFTIMEHDVLEYYKVPEFSNADFLIPVKGSSMQPKYYGGDILACKHIQSFSFFQWGVPHVITIKDRGTVVKRIKQVENKNEFSLVSDNEKYEPFTITIDDIVNIAIVVGVIRVEN